MRELTVWWDLRTNEANGLHLQQEAETAGRLGVGEWARAILDSVQLSNNVSMKALKGHIKCRMLKAHYY